MAYRTTQRCIYVTVCTVHVIRTHFHMALSSRKRNHMFDVGTVRGRWFYVLQTWAASNWRLGFVPCWPGLNCWYGTGQSARMWEGDANHVKMLVGAQTSCFAPPMRIPMLRRCTICLVSTLPGRRWFGSRTSRPVHQRPCVWAPGMTPAAVMSSSTYWSRPADPTLPPITWHLYLEAGKVSLKANALIVMACTSTLDLTICRL